MEQGAGQACLVVRACYPDKGVLLGVVVLVVVVVGGTIAPAVTLDGDVHEVQYAAGMDIVFQLHEVRAKMEGGFVAPCHHQSRGPLLVGRRCHQHCPMVVIVVVVAYTTGNAMGIAAISVVGLPIWE